MARPLRLILSIAIGVSWWAAGAQASEFTGQFSRWVAPENPKCTCRFKGEHLPIGALRCLQTPNGPRTAECVTEQNVTSWRPGSEPCPAASNPLPHES